MFNQPRRQLVKDAWDTLSNLANSERSEAHGEPGFDIYNKWCKIGDLLRQIHNLLVEIRSLEKDGN